MPTYEYECRACSHTFEAEQRIVEDPMKDCPSCGQENSLKRLVQPAAIHFRGSGFHVTDYAARPRDERPEGASPGCTGDQSSCPTCATEQGA
ncbi:MAG: zinc ribbon domain-containing protein [Armatimonadetes bacterium]|nr:zinc ribbon domain-containing protein [Armatimonadota bacterium]NOG92117.1 zinc ribbon domain-containing protein [Armatimonadota bacterium]